jgi:hypothetical protein
MKKGLLFPVFLLIALFVQQPLHAQTISVSVNVKPPYSLRPADYIQQGNNVMISMTNLDPVAISAQVFTSLEGINNSVQIKIRPGYMAAVPLQFGPRETKTLTLNQLKAYNGYVGFNDIIFQGYDSKLYFGNGTLPEGMYKVCATVVTTSAAGGGGTFSGCGIFMLRAYDAPIILNPYRGSTVKPLQPQNIFFNWTPAGIAGKTNYSFKLVDLTETPVNDPNDAFINNVQPFFQQNGIIINSLVYDYSKLKLKEGHRYALQVTAYDPLKTLLYKNSGRSPVTVFLYKNELGPANNAGDKRSPDDAPKGPCTGTTKWSGDLTKANKDGLPNGTALAVGHFIIRNTVFTKTNGGYDGTGEVLVNFLNTKLKVEFKNIKVNSDNRVYDGVVTAKVISKAVINDEMSKQKTGIIENVPAIDSLMVYVETGTRTVNKLNPNNAATDLPVHFDKSDSKIAVVGLIFEPAEAYINLILNTQLPQGTGNGPLLLTAKAIPIHPNGYGETGVKLLLAKDTRISFSDKGPVDFTSDVNKTFATYDCSGVKGLTLNGEVIVNKNQQ